MDKDMSILHRIIQSANIRQKVIASNIANADTPGYKAKEVSFGNILENKIKLLTTDSGHIKNQNQEGISAKITVTNDPSWGDRNNVLLNSEIAKMTENTLTYDAAVKLINSKMKMLKSAMSTR